MEIQTRVADNVTILDIHGDITFSEGSAELHRKVQSLLELGVKNILLNAQGVIHIDSSGIGQLMNSYTTVKKEGGQLKLLNLTKMLYQVLSITNLLGVFSTFDNEQKAIGSFSSFPEQDGRSGREERSC